ncbi:MAG: hypothetical protein MJ124_02075 [Lachnospiraceae bacterium]|nr:hypothetical protein [Lachnospiraceae bacterium]
MKNSKAMLLLGTMFKATSSLNTLKYSKDKKKRGQIIGTAVGYALIYLLIIAYGAGSSYGVGTMGMGDSIPALTVISLFAVGFIFTLLKSNGYLYNFKEYDMLMSMPFEIKTIISCKFMYMYIKSLGLPYALSVSMMVGYGLSVKPAFYVYPCWLIISLFLPLIPTVLASAIGSIVASVGHGNRFQKMIQTVLIFALVIFSFMIRFIIESIVRDSKGEEILEQISGVSDATGNYYPPANWFRMAIVDGNILAMIAIILVSVVIFVAYYTIISKVYKKLNSRLSANAVHKTKGEIKFSKKSVVRCIAIKEVRRLFASVTYMTNLGIGPLMVVIMGVASLFFPASKVIETLFQGAPIEPEKIVPAIPFVIYFFTGMMSTTCVTPSLEGKNYWIIKSMPIKPADVYRGKMLFNLYVEVPFSVFSVSCLCFCFRTDILTWLVQVLLVTALCLFSTSFGMILGIKHMKLEWENEIEVIKQGTAVGFYIMINMFLTMAAGAAAVIGSFTINSNIIQLGIAVIYVIIALICYRIVIKKPLK